MRAGKLWRLAESKGSRLIVALDNVDVEPVELVEEFEEYAVGVKVGLPFILRWGPEAARELCKTFGGTLYMLCDLKLADIPQVVAEELRLIRGLGFDGAIVHLFQGGAREFSSLEGRPELYGLVAMTHAESRRIDERFAELVGEAVSAGLEGIVVPATKPHVVRAAREAAPGLTLLAPGVGAQGPPPGSALKAGADFEIVGRAVVASGDPRSAAKAIRDLHARLLGARES